jgi:hypothetical protein
MNSGKITEWRRVYKVRTRYTVSVEKIEYVAAESLDDALDEQKLREELSRHSHPPLDSIQPGKPTETKFEVIDGEVTTPGEPLKGGWDTSCIPWREDIGCCEISDLWQDQLAAEMARIAFPPESLPDTCPGCEENVIDGWMPRFEGDEILVICHSCYFVLAREKKIEKNGATP